jgi:FkbM family methyltransferase
MGLTEWAKTKTWEVMTLGKGVPRIVDGHRFRIDPRARWLMDENKEPELRRFMSQRVRPNDLLIDVGAHAGFYVMLFCKWAREGRVIAFEPNPDTRQVLKRNIALNQLKERVIVEPFAVSDRVSQMDFFMLPADGRSRLGQVFHAEVNRAAKVAITSLDDYLASRPVQPQWLLIDIEGYEIAALRGARRLIETNRRDLTIVVEMHPNCWLQSGTSRQELEQLLAELKLKALPLTGQKDPLDEYGIVQLAC